MTNKIIQTELAIEKGASVLEQLHFATGLTDKALIDAATKGAIWHKKPRGGKLKRIRDISHAAPIGIGHTLFVNYNEEVLAEEPPIPKLISDEVNYSIWKKPKGMWSQGSKWGDHCTITEVVKSVHNKPSYLVHRLDKATSGLMVVAHTKEATKRLTVLFAERKVKKLYRAIVKGHFNKDLPFELSQNLDDKTALTIVETSKYDEKANASELTLRIETGRKHQIRRHLANIDFPVVGDRLYGDADNQSPDLQLVAYKLAFICPFTGKELSFKA